MDLIKANEWLLEMENNFRLLRCGEQQKVEIGSYLLVGATSRWWNPKGVREPSMDYGQFKVISRISMYLGHCRMLNVYNLNN